MQLDPHDPAVHIARDRLGLDAEKLIDYPEEAFEHLPNPEVRFAAYQRLLHNNWEQIHGELKRMEQKGVTLAEFQHAGSPEDFPYKVLNGGSTEKVISVITPADSRRDRVIQMTLEKAEAAKQRILTKEEASNQQLQRSRAELEQISQACHSIGQKAKSVAVDTRNRNAERQERIAEKLKKRVDEAENRIAWGSQQLEHSNKEKSRQLRVRMQQAQETAYGLSDQAKREKQQRLYELKKYVDDRIEQREKSLAATRAVVSANCKTIKQAAEEGKEKIEQRIETLAVKVQDFETHHDEIVREEKQQLVETATEAAKRFNERHLEVVEGAKEIKQVEKNIKQLYTTIKTERADLNLQGAGSRRAKEEQLVETRNECKEEQARLMKERIAARVAYKKEVYDEFNSNVPFTL